MCMDSTTPNRALQALVEEGYFNRSVKVLSVARVVSRVALIPG